MFKFYLENIMVQAFQDLKNVKGVTLFLKKTNKLWTLSKVQDPTPYTNIRVFAGPGP